MCATRIGERRSRASGGWREDVSTFAADPAGTPPQADGIELLEGAPVALGGPRGMSVSRTLPSRHRRMVGT
jgi:quercetin 2,3-dioxygenase